MFTIVISEKGGAERRETFVQGEVVVGRAQGVDLRLDKGNVSKQHAKLALKDGRFIVSDLKSTNGTWVNGKKIANATILREGDKVYVGDFVLRVEMPSLGSGAPIPIDLASAEALALATPSRGFSPPPLPAPPFEFAPAPVRHTARPDSVAAPRPISSPPPPPAAPARGAARGATVMLGQVAAAVPPAGAPLPAHAGHHHAPLSPARPTLPPAPPAPPAPPPPPAPTVPPADPAAPLAASIPSPPPSMSAYPQPPADKSARAPKHSARAPRMPEATRTSEDADTSLVALAIVVERAFDVVGRSGLRDGRPLDETTRRRLEQAVREQVVRLRSEDPLTVSPDFESRAIEEATEGGALGALLRDDDVVEIVGAAGRVLSILRHDGSISDAPAVASDSALLYALRRIASEGGLPWTDGEGTFEGALRSGTNLTACSSPLCATTTFSLAKRRFVAADLASFAAATGLGLSFAEIGAACIHVRANLLISAPTAAEGARLLAAFSSEFSRERILLVGGIEVPDLRSLRDVVVVPSSDDRVIQTALRLRVDRIIVAPLVAATVVPVLDAITAGARGMLVVVVAPSLRQALARTSAQLVMGNPGLSPEAAREIVAEAFDVAFELSDVLSAKTRITRIAEVAGSDSKQVLTRDLFSAVDFGGTDTTLAATGVVPRFLQDFASRGVRLDPGLFRRGA